jgi:sulfate/thiosulfate transport system substrate-binding protein
VKAGVQPDAAKALVTRIFANVPVLDGGGRGATTTFAQRNIGDALVTFESEVPLIVREFGDHFEVVYPSRTILAENPVSVVDKVVDKKGTRKLAEAYLQFCTPRARRSPPAPPAPAHRQGAGQYAKAFPKVNTFTVDEVFGGWTQGPEGALQRRRLYDQIILAALRR